MAFNIKIILAATILLSLMNKSTAIYCYYCSSANNSACIDPNAYDDETKARAIPVIDCEAAIPAMNSIHFFCRKILQTIYLPHQKIELRVTRGCGWVPHEKPCYRNDHADHLETVCQCYSNHCNGADPLPTPMTVSVLILSACIYSYFYR